MRGGWFFEQILKICNIVSQQIYLMNLICKFSLMYNFTKWLKNKEKFLVLLFHLYDVYK